MDCIVRDVTERGSRLEVSETIALPDVSPNSTFPTKTNTSTPKSHGGKPIVSE